MKGPPAGTEALSASRIKLFLVLSYLVRDFVYFVFIVLDRVRYVGLRGPPRVKVRTLCGQNPLFLSVDFDVTGFRPPHAPQPPPTPQYQNRGRNTDDNGNSMLQMFFFRIIYGRHR